MSGLNKFRIFGLTMTWLLLHSAIAAEPGAIQVSPGFALEEVMSTALGLQLQIALHPDGSVLITDPNNHRIVGLKDGRISTLIAAPDLKPFFVASLPDGRLVYGTNEGIIRALNLSTGVHTTLGASPAGETISTLATDHAGTVFAVTSKRDVIRLNPGGNSRIATGLPFPNNGFSITDMAVTPDGTIYVAGFNRVVSVDPGSGAVKIVSDNLQYEPVWVSAAPDNRVYINDVSHGLQAYDPVTGLLTNVVIPGFLPYGDIIALSREELIFFDFEAFFQANLNTLDVTALFVVSGNSFAFAVNNAGSVFYATPSHPPVLQSRIIRLQANGMQTDLLGLSFPRIIAADVDSQNRLCLATSEGFVRLEFDGSLSTREPILPADFSNSLRELAIGPDGYWNVITTDRRGLIEVYRFSDADLHATFLPIAFSADDFGSGLELGDTSIDVGADGRLAIVATANGIGYQGPAHQRVFRANADGTGLREVANLDSMRTGGMVDISVAPNNDVFVLGMQPQSLTGLGGDAIYRIRESGEVSKLVSLSPGHDPKSLDVDADGVLWFSATTGVYRVPGVSPPASRSMTRVSGNTLSTDGKPVCAMILANGQSTHSCAVRGGFSLDVPLDEDGQVTLLAFANGFLPTRLRRAPADLPRAVLMSRSAGAPLVSASEELVCSAAGRVRVSGMLEGQDGEPLCGMVLINGQHAFTCGTDPGRYRLDAAIGATGQVNVFAFADGMRPYHEVHFAPECFE